MKESDVITIVSGLPRSGTSMMMSMLEAGGIEPVVDDIRKADEDNPKGYYEFERVKQVKKDQAWLEDAKGKLVKVISQLLRDLPPAYQYKVIFMRRNIDEILASQKQMLIRRGTHDESVKDEDMGKMLLAHVDQVLKWLDAQDNFDWIEADYNAILKGAGPHIDKVNEFLGGDLNTVAMAAVVDKALYRQRK
ncbi:MAG: sulfotransferase family protein [Phycisphaerae bacterium]|nr:sulfotransferase family protein [Phycisphaerae bacterium]